MKKMIVILFLFCLIAPAVALFAQEAPADAAVTVDVDVIRDFAAMFDWQSLLALFINSILVVVAVELVKRWLPTASGTLKQILAIVAGPALLFAAKTLSNALGYPIDFQPLIDLFTGLTASLGAMGMFEIGRRAPGVPLK